MLITPNDIPMWIKTLNSCLTYISHSIIMVSMACKIILLLLSFFNICDCHFQQRNKPHVVIFVADDVGRNDFSMHGSNQVPTPNIDALGYNGIILNKHYTQNTCTPSRAALLTGQYPMRSGMQGSPIHAGENRSLPENMPTMAEHFKKLGYKTHLVGKWHQGAAYRRSTPTGRGFDTHFGYWNGFTGYFNHMYWQDTPYNSTFKGHDFRDQMTPAWNVFGNYTTSLLTDRASDIIEKHDKRNPMLLMITHLAGHTGFDGDELGVPNITETNTKYAYIKDERRRRYADIINILDKSVGKVIKKLSDTNMLKNSIIVFMTDNGAPSLGMYANSGSNWPLRGIKATDFEGGVRGTAVVYSPLFKKQGYISNELFHLSDWLPTLFVAAGGNLKDLGKLDGVNQWRSLSLRKPTQRKEMLISIDEVIGYSSLIYTRFKFMNGSNTNLANEQYSGDDGSGSEVPFYDMTEVLNTDVNKAIKKLTSGRGLQYEDIIKKRKQLDISNCRDKNFSPYITCSKSPCLFDLYNDPCETKNIINEEPELADKLWKRIQVFLKETVPQTNMPTDPRSNPIYYNNTWCTWLEDSYCVKTPQNVEHIL